MADIEALRMQTYSPNLELLLQQRGSKFRKYCRKENAAGSKAHRFLSQLDKVTASRRVASAEVIDNSAAIFTGRWVMAPLPIHFDKILDTIDTVQSNIQPGGPLLQAAVSALNRQIDDDFLTAYFGTALTGETGGTSTSFTAGNQVAASVGSSTGLNVDKLSRVYRLMQEAELDLDVETPVIAVSPKQEENLRAQTQVISTDFNSNMGGKPVLEHGRIKHFMGFDFIISNRLPVDGSSDRRLPVWVPSGMGEAAWFDVKSDIRQLPNYKGNPFLVEAESMIAFTRLEENRCFEIKCTE
jgi:hypothetical protein